MSYQIVEVFVLNKMNNEPLEGVNVRVYGEDNVTLFTDAVTDSSGKASFTLFTQRYALRFYKFQARFTQPQYFEVVEGTNSFNVYAELLDKEPSPDPRLCRASGCFRDITGAPHPFLDIIFIGEFAPILLDGCGVLSERRMIRTNKEGWGCIDLIRGACYAATIEGYEDQTRQISVPDAPSVNLPDLLFPTVGSVSFDLPSPWTLSVGSTLELTPFILTSTGIPMESLARQNLRFEAEDPSVAQVVYSSPTTIRLRAMAPGSTKLIARRTNLSIIKIPFSKEVTGSGQTITVS